MDLSKNLRLCLHRVFKKIWIYSYFLNTHKAKIEIKHKVETKVGKSLTTKNTRKQIKIEKDNFFNLNSN